MRRPNLGFESLDFESRSFLSNKLKSYKVSKVFNDFRDLVFVNYGTNRRNNRFIRPFSGVFFLQLLALQRNLLRGG